MLAMLLLSQVTTIVILQFTTWHAPFLSPTTLNFNHTHLVFSENKMNLSPLLFILFILPCWSSNLLPYLPNNCCLISTNTIPRAASYHCCLSSSSHSFSAAIFPELRPPIFPNEFTLDNPLMLLLPPSFMVRVFLDLLGLEQVMSTPSWSMSWGLSFFTTTNLAMLLLQNGQTGGTTREVEGLGLLWQHRASVHCAHIWWPQSCTSIVHTCSKQMQHNSVSLTWIIKINLECCFILQN